MRDSNLKKCHVAARLLFFRFFHFAEAVKVAVRKTPIDKRLLLSELLRNIIVLLVSNISVSPTVLIP